MRGALGRAGGPPPVDATGRTDRAQKCGRGFTAALTLGCKSRYFGGDV
jgi:hypothetical protein